MNRPRIIPVMLISERRAVKTVRFAEPRYIGDPVNTAKIFSDKGVDELIVLDISPSPRKGGLDFSYISRIAEEAFMPFSFGGGIVSLKDAEKLFNLGIEKVVLGWNGEDTLNLMTEIACVYGVQAVAICLDVSADKKILKKLNKKGVCVEHRANAAQLISRIQDAGGGEIILQNVDLDGMMNGMDYALIDEVCSSVRLPVVALGGAGSLDDLVKALIHGANAVASGSSFVFHDSGRAVLINYPTDSEIVSSFEKMKDK